MSQLAHLVARIEAAAQRSGRKASDVHILPVSKSQTIERLKVALAEKGFPQRLGENYFQELQDKQAALKGAIEWHFIGPLQSRKVEEIAQRVSFIHSVCREKELKLLRGTTVKFLLQVNTSGEGQKNGVPPAELPQLLQTIADLGLTSQCVGLMCLPSPLEEVGEKALRKEFALLRRLRDKELPHGGLSMGMSGDFELAIEEGSTWVRVGSLLFGARA